MNKEKRKRFASLIMIFILGLAFVLIISESLLGALGVDEFSIHVIINMLLELYIVGFIIVTTRNKSSRDKKENELKELTESISLNFRGKFNLIRLSFFTISVMMIYYLGQRIGIYVLSNGSSINADLDIASADVTKLFVITLIISATVVSPIVEEIICRHYLYNFSKKRFGVFVAIFVNSFIFAILHASFAVMPYTFALGVVLSLIVYCYGSVVYAIIIHMILNAISLMFALPPFASYETFLLGLIILGVIICLVSYVSIFIFNERNHA